MTQTSNQTNGFYKLNWLQRIGFGAGDMAQNLIYQTISMWLLFPTCSGSTLRSRQ